MVYPRVGGGNYPDAPLSPRCPGLSPRGRGKRDDFRARAGARWSIPAWAGETQSQSPPQHFWRVYPRVGGGNGIVRCASGYGAGLSPRGRGKRFASGGAGCARRSIPAWAGETKRPRPPPPVKWVYPRVGGGNLACHITPFLSGGLSPRGRGKPDADDITDAATRSIPAWAGETAGEYSFQFKARVYPRVGGGNGFKVKQNWKSHGLSPRGRGKRLAGYSAARKRRSIPAWAGETVPMGGWQVRNPVYPRVGGGNRGELVVPKPIRGLSPRGRGKRRHSE